MNSIAQRFPFIKSEMVLFLNGAAMDPVFYSQTLKKRRFLITWSNRLELKKGPSDY